MYCEFISEFELLNRSFCLIFKAFCKACRIGTDLSRLSHSILKARRGVILIILSVSGTEVAFKSNVTQASLAVAWMYIHATARLA